MGKVMIELVVVIIVITFIIFLFYLIFNLVIKFSKKNFSKVVKLILSVAISFSIVCFCFFRVVDSRDYQVFGELVNRGKTSKKVVALTLDDGPTANYTQEVLKILSEKNVKATFFLTGKELKENINLGKEIVKNGHQIGNHSYSHERMVFKSLPFIKNEIETTNKLIKETGYSGEIVFRSPYGKKFLLLPYYLKQAGMKNIMWDLEPESIPTIANDFEKISSYVVDNIKPGSILLLHIMYKSREESRKSLPKVIDELKNKGFEFVTVSELLKE